MGVSLLPTWYCAAPIAAARDSEERKRVECYNYTVTLLTCFCTFTCALELEQIGTLTKNLVKEALSFEVSCWDWEQAQKPKAREREAQRPKKLLLVLRVIA